MMFAGTSGVDSHMLAHAPMIGIYINKYLFASRTGDDKCTIFDVMVLRALFCPIDRSIDGVVGIITRRIKG